jgi:predicted enzyme related to lactoylglutathione lyase
MVSTLGTNLEIKVITITVTNLEQSRQFYEELLDFEIKAFYEPTRWISYRCRGGAFFAILEAVQSQPPQPDDEIDFYVEDIEMLWQKVKGSANVVEGLHATLWGGWQFVLADPDGYRLGFVKERPIKK